MKKKIQHKAGYTLIELMLSVAFLSSLAVVIALVVANSTAVYRRGLTLKNVNMVASEIIDDFRSSINNNSITGLDRACETAFTSDSTRENCKSDGGYSLASLTRRADVLINGDVTKYLPNTPVYGAFCTGKYSYIWNSGYFFNSSIYTVKNATAATFKYKYMGTDYTLSDFRLLKIFDETRSVCISATKSHATTSSGDPAYTAGMTVFSNVFDVTGYRALPEQPVDLIGKWINGTNLALYDLTIARPAATSVEKDIFYSGGFILGTVEGGVDIQSTGDYCRAYVDEAIGMEDYCAVNRFNFAVQTSGI